MPSKIVLCASASYLNFDGGRHGGRLAAAALVIEASAARVRDSLRKSRRRVLAFE